jgi:hypothetical protein
MNASSRKTSDKKAVFILEDSPDILESWRNSLKLALKDVGGISVRGSQTIDEAWAAIHDIERDGYALSVVIVDIVKGKGAGEDREWGIHFLEDVKNKYPGVFRIAFSGQLERPEIQALLDKGLIHDFEDKGLRMDWKGVERVAAKVKCMLQGINVGNVQSPSAEHEFRLFLDRWIDSLPEKENTEMRSLDGRIFKVGELRENPQLREDFRRAFEAIRLDEMTGITEKEAD